MMFGQYSGIPNSTGPGTSGFVSYWPQPSPPAIVTEWAALIPLVIHLASWKEDYNLVGELAFTGKLTLSLFPKLGHLSGVARLLSEIPDFLDRASSKSDLSSVVWDVDWGSTFACANGAARDCLTRFALKKSGPVVNLEDKLSKPLQTRPSSQTSSTSSRNQNYAQKIISEDSPESRSQYRRYQTLNVIEINRCRPPKSKQSRRTWHVALRLVSFVSLLALAVVLFLWGALGTAAIVLLCAATQLVCLIVPAGRPLGYMKNYENHDSACMMSAIHENASTWYLFKGDRSSIDWLLNKTMITVDPDRRAFCRLYFRAAHFFQLIAMTYVAAQKGWDGVCLLCLLVLNAAFQLITGFPAHRAAAEWISDNGLEVKATRFALTGRIPMLGAIQLMSSNKRPHREGFVHGKVDWMDDILHPTARRKVWANELANFARRRSVNPSAPTVDDEVDLPQNDRDWVDNNLRWAKEAYQCIEGELRGINNIELANLSR